MPKTEVTASTDRSVVIDLLRGVAVILVMFRHRQIVPVLHEAGWIGVDLFFVLSGFLVSGLLFKEYQRNGKVRGIHFLIRRGFKIYPMFYFFLATSVIIKLLTGSPPSRSVLLSEVFFVQNYFDHMWVHTWSLAVEEHFYIFLALFMALLVWSCRASNFRFLNRSLISMIVFIAGYRCYHAWTSVGFDLHEHFYPTHLRADGLLWGVLISVNYHYRREDFVQWFRGRSRTWLLLCAPCLLMPFLVYHSSIWMYSIGFSILYVGFGVLLSVAVSLPTDLDRWKVRLQSMPVRWMARVGFFSYSIYLWHVPIAVLVHRAEGFLWNTGSWLGTIAYFTASILIGQWTSLLIEQPVLRLRDRWFPRPTSVPVS